MVITSNILLSKQLEPVVRTVKPEINNIYLLYQTSNTGSTLFVTLVLVCAFMNLVVSQHFRRRRALDITYTI
jgi:hypothetical protein